MSPGFLELKTFSRRFYKLSLMWFQGIKNLILGNRYLNFQEGTYI